MRILTPTALLALTLTLPCLAIADTDDLYSEVAVESVFGGGKAESTSSKTPTTAATPRVTGAGQLGKLLRDAGMEPERLDGKAVKVVIAHGEWTIPTTLRAAVDRGQIDVVMGLATPAKDSKWTTDKLLALLSAGPGAGGAHFAWDRSAGQVQLRRSLSARAVTASRLNSLLTEMAELAVSREDSWYTEEKKTTTAAAPKRLVGSYVASLGAGEAFALNLTNQGGFALAHVKAGKTTTSRGKLERSGATMKLVGEGVTITGTVSAAGDTGFTLTLAGGKQLLFKKSGK